jgi:sterol desaturase/sphingolipid hydroxylase (fatty acid hydroxylase superfamily)
MELEILTKSTLFFALVLVGVEFFFSYSRKFFFSIDTGENLIWFSFNKVLSLLFLGSLIYYINNFISHRISFRLDLTVFGLFTQFVVFFIVSDLFSFFSHRILHALPWAWRFHKLHHSSTKLTTLSSFRHHSFEDLWYATILGSVGGVFIVQNEIKLIVYFLMTAACYFQHAYLRLRFPEWVNHIFVTPLNHRWHHSVELIKPNGQNFGLVLSVWDKIFGTYFVPDYEPLELGLKTFYPKALWRRWIHPFTGR